MIYLDFDRVLELDAILLRQSAGQPQPIVGIRAVGVKRGNRVFILNEEVQW
jgi:hypothetical protein